MISNDGCAPFLIGGRMRDEFLNETLSFHLEDARTKIAASVAAMTATDRIRPCDSLHLRSSLPLSHHNK
jgi:hypothetical protein